jgi:methyl-accepting chemotaxis protein
MVSATSQSPTLEQKDQLEIEFEKNELVRKGRLLRSVCLILAITYAATIPAYLGLAVFMNQQPLIFGAGLSSLSLVGFVVSYRLAGKIYSRIISWLVTAALFLNVGFALWIMGTECAIDLALFIPIGLAIGLMSIAEVWLITGLSLLIGIAIYVCEHLLKVYSPPLGLSSEQQAIVSIISIIFVLPVTVWLLVIPLRSQITAIRSQNQRLKLALGEIETRQRTGQQFSQQVLMLASQLNTSASQQAAGTQEQVAAVSEVTTSLEELNESASQIAASAASASEAANQTVQVATQVRETNELVKSAVTEGNQAVEQAVESVARVRNRIELLGQRLLHLTEQTRQVSSIIDIIEEIADETHLLALNASIEAAGGILNEDTSEAAARTTSRGERFGVIALEVKNLSDRSREATEEVRQGIAEMQGAVAAAVLVAEEGKKETSAALSRSQIAGAVIEKLNEVISSSVSRADQILSSVEEVNLRCDEISVATSQQRTANQQILYTMRNIVEVSQQSAGVVTELSETANRVNTHITELSQVFDKPMESVRTNGLVPALA